MRRPSEEIVDAEIIEDAPPRHYGTVNQVMPPPGMTFIGQQPPAPPADLQISVPDARGRAITLFVEVPLLAYVALTPGISGLVRLAAAGLGVYRISQLVAPGDELQIVGPG